MVRPKTAIIKNAALLQSILLLLNQELSLALGEGMLPLEAIDNIIHAYKGGRRWAIEEKINPSQSHFLEADPIIIASSQS